MNFQKPPVETWEIMLQAKTALGGVALQNIFSVGTTQINRYCRNPEFTADSERNPIDRLRILFRDLSAQGGEELVQAALNHLASVIGCRVVLADRPEPDKPTLAEECLDDIPSLALFHSLIQAGEPPAVTEKALEKHIAEVREDQTMYERDYNARVKVNAK